MRKELMLKGKNVDEKLVHVERILQRIQRRMNKVVIGVIPPVVLPAYVQHPMESGLLMSWVVPLGGELIRGIMVVNRYNTDKQVKFRCKVDREEGGVFYNFETHKSVPHNIDFKLDVKMGDKITISIEDPKIAPKHGTPAEAEGEFKWAIEDVNISFLLKVDPGETTTKRFLFDQLEELTEGVLEDDDEGV